MAKKTSMGRQRIKIVKIQKKNHLQVTFSKRRSGLFKKASELSTFCGVEIAIIIFSPAGKVFSFGHPNVETMIHRFITCNPNPNCNVNQFAKVHRNGSIRDLNFQLTQVLNELEAETKIGETLDKMRKAGQSQLWWKTPIEKLALHELEQLRESMEELKKSVTYEINKFFGKNINMLPFLGSNDLHICEQFKSNPSRVDNPYVHNFSYGHGFF